MLGVWVLESIYWVRSLLRYRVEEAVLEFLQILFMLGCEMFQEEEQLEMNRSAR